MTKLGQGIARISDSLLAQVAPRAEASAVTCTPNGLECCVTYGARAVHGYQYWDRLTRRVCFCNTDGADC